MDVVGYSKLLIREQTELLRRLSEIVRSTAQVRTADAEGNLIRLPTGDGMTLVFFGDPEAPIKCATEIAAALKNEPDIALRQGIHSGPVDRVLDVNDRPNAAGAGIDLAQRMMDCGDARHILLSKRVADDLAPYPRWNPHLHDLGETEVKHRVRVHLFNLYTDEAGNPAVPSKLETEASRSGPKIRARFGWRALIFGALVLLSLGVVAWWFATRPTKPAPGPEPAHSQAEALEKSIAVLPLENLSDDKKDAFSADGIQDDT